jgi:enamine deaminase RidA (YjgF/YER057c/UK114 family)
MSLIEERLTELGIRLPPVQPPVANYVQHVLSGSLLFVSGQGPLTESGQQCRGKVGLEVSTEVAYQHARLAGIQLLAVASAALGNLDRVQRVVKVLGLINATPDFVQHPAVINGCSDLLVQVFGARGRHARSAIGVGGLPDGITVEIEAIFDVD